VVCAKAQEFAYGQEHFDLANARDVLFYLPDARRIIAKVYGALKPPRIFFGEEIVQIYVKHNGDFLTSASMVAQVYWMQAEATGSCDPERSSANSRFLVRGAD